MRRALGLAAIGLGCAASGPPEPVVRRAEPLDLPAPPPAVDADSLTAALRSRAAMASTDELPAVEAEIQAWLGRFEFEDPTLRPAGSGEPRFFREIRGRLLDALGWAAFRRGDIRQAEAALVSAVAEINTRGTTTGFAEPFLHLGRVFEARSRRDEAIDAYLNAEARGVGAGATPTLESAWRRRHGSLAGLDAARTRLAARIEDERRQLLVVDPLAERLSDLRWPRRTGPPLLAGPPAGGEPFVVAAWDACAGCEGLVDRLGPLAAALQRRGSVLVGVWLGDDPAAAGPPASFPILLPPDPGRERARLARGPTPVLLVVDGGGVIRYRWRGADAIRVPLDDILVQVDHLARRAEIIRSAPGTRTP